MEDDLVYDVGLHLGQDSAYYLRKGFRVVAVEANPVLVARASERFRGAIADGRMTIVHGAVADSVEKTVTFLTHPEMSIWGTTDPNWTDSTVAPGQIVPITVPALSFGDVLAQHGVPYFMKIDIEGADTLCLESLLEVPVDERPVSVSLESDKRDWAKLIQEFDLLERLRYNRFAVVQQAGSRGSGRPIRRRDGNWVVHEFESQGSGPFGEDLNQAWLDRSAALRRYRRIFRGYKAMEALRAWAMSTAREGCGSDVAGSTQAETANGKASRVEALRAAAFNLAARRLGRPVVGWYDTHALRIES